MWADTCTGTTCSQTRFGHCAPDGCGIRTPCFRGTPAWAGRARSCRAAREAGGTRGLAETGSASAAGGVVVVLWRDADCGTPPRGRRNRRARPPRVCTVVRGVPDHTGSAHTGPPVDAVGRLRNDRRRLRRSRPSRRPGQRQCTGHGGPACRRPREPSRDSPRAGRLPRPDRPAAVRPPSRGPGGRRAAGVRRGRHAGDPSRERLGGTPGRSVPAGGGGDRRRTALAYVLDHLTPEAPGRTLPITVKEDPGGRASPHLVYRTRPTTVLRLGPAQGEFTLPDDPLPPRILMVTAGSDITPMAGMLRTLARRHFPGPPPTSYSCTAHPARTSSSSAPNWPTWRPGCPG